jgi:hypothetical protein
MSERCGFVDATGNQCLRPGEHDLRRLKHLIVNAVGNPVYYGRPAHARRKPTAWPMGGPPPLCELCAKRPAEVRSYRASRTAQGLPTLVRHGAICRPCLVTLSIAARSCPPRRRDDPEALEAMAQAEDVFADRLVARGLKLRGARFALRDAFHNLDVAVRVASPDSDAYEREWLFDLLEPGWIGFIRAVRRALSTTTALAQRRRETAGRMKWRAEQARRGVVDFDNPFEDPDFIQRVMADEANP